MTNFSDLLIVLAGCRRVLYLNHLESVRNICVGLSSLPTSSAPFLCTSNLDQLGEGGTFCYFFSIPPVSRSVETTDLKSLPALTADNFFDPRHLAEHHDWLKTKSHASAKKITVSTYLLYIYIYYIYIFTVYI